MALNPFANRAPMNVSRGRPVVIDQQQSFAGGLNTVSAPDALAPNQFRVGQNGRLTLFGAFTKRGGTQRTAAALIAATLVQNGYAWNQPAGTTLTMAVCGGTLFTTTYGAFPLTWTQRGSVADLSTTVTPSLAEFLQLAGTDSVYIADGGLLNRYTGTTLTKNIAGTPSVNVLAVHNQRLWGCGDPTYPDSIWYSALNDGDSLGISASSGGQIVVRTFGDQNVVGLISLGTSLMIFHQRGVSRLTGYGQDDVTVTPAGISGDVGTIAPFSLARVDTLVYFVSDRGLYRASEQEVQAVNTPQTPDPLAILLPTMTAANIANIRTVFNRGTRELWIQIPGVGVYIYHTVLQAWAGPWDQGYQSPQTQCLFETNNTSGYPIILKGDASGFVSECDRPSGGAGAWLDNVASDGSGGQVYTMTLQCRRFYCDDTNTAKSWRYGYVLATATTGDLTVAWSTKTVTTSQAVTVTSEQTSYRVDLSGNGYWVDITLTDNTAVTSVTVDQVKVQGFALGRR